MATATAIDPQPIKEALLFFEFSEGKRPYSAEMDNIRLFLSAYDLNPDNKANPKTHYLRESLKAYLSCLHDRIPVVEFCKWGRAGGLSNSQLEFVQQVGDTWLTHWLQHQRAIAPVQRAPVESSRPKPTQVQTVLQPGSPVELAMPDSGVIELSPPGEMTTPLIPKIDGQRLVNILNRAINKSGIEYQLDPRGGMFDGIRFVEFHIRQNLEKDDGNCPIMPPEALDKLSRTLKVHLGLSKPPVLYDGDGCTVVQIEKPSFAPIPLEKYLPKQFSKRPDQLIELPLGIGMGNQIVTTALRSHMLIGGTSGGGKSSSFDTIFCYLTQAYAPCFLRIVAIDPQGSTFDPYDRTPWLFGGKVLEDKWSIMHALQRIKAIADERSELFKGKCRDFIEYNQIVTAAIAAKKATVANYLPFVVILIEEQAETKEMFDLRDEKDDEPTSAQYMSMISSIARAYRKWGIHIIAGLQRPSKEAGGPMPAELAANLRTRLAFEVADANNSEIILGPGYPQACQLAGEGDAFLLDRRGYPVRLQGFFIKSMEARRRFEQYRDRHFDSSTGWSSHATANSFPEEFDDMEWEPELFPIPSDPLTDPPMIENSDPVANAIAQLRRDQPNISESALINALTDQGLISGNWKKKQEIVRRYS